MVADDAALETVSLAEDVTFDNPWEAFDATFETLSFAFVAALDTASEVVEAFRTKARRVRRSLDCRSSIAGAVDGIVC